jgi:hypothetical protein
MDKDKLTSKFIAADIFNENSALQAYSGFFDIIYAAAFFPLFDWDRQVEVARRLVALLRPCKGSLIVGTQNGNIDPAAGTNKELIGKMFQHDEASFRKLWAQVASETATQWSVNVEHVEDQFEVEGGSRWNHGGVRRLHFSMRRI